MAGPPEATGGVQRASLGKRNDDKRFDGKGLG